MGTIINNIGCNCCKDSKYAETKEDTEYSNRVINSIGDIQIKTENFISKRTQTIDNIYMKILLLSRSDFCEIYKAKKKKGNEIRIIKEIMKSSLEDKNQVLNEIKILSKLDHPNIVKIYEYYEDNDTIYLVEDYCDGGDVADKMDRNGVFCEFLVKYIMYHTFIAMNFLHLKHVVHGNIKRENILLSFYENDNTKIDVFQSLSENKEIQEQLIKAVNYDELSEEAKKYANELANIEILISDFGSAKMKKNSEKSKKVKEVNSTNFYSSPEAIKGNFSYECDEWSCGVLMYILLSGIAPFRGRTEEDILKNIREGNVDLNIDELKHISPSCKDLLSKLLQKNPEERIKTADVLKHDFFTKGVIINKLMEKKNKSNLSKLSRYAHNTTMAKNNLHHKRSVFREAVIAYMALNFTDKEEANQIKGVFRELTGDDPKFEITKETFIEKMKGIAGDSYTDKQLSELFDTIDGDRSGKIEYEELIRALGDQKKLINEKNLRETFNFFDKSKNGKISLKEISDIVFQGKKVPLNVMKEFQEQINLKDENSEITFEQFVEYMGYKNLLNE